MTNEEAKEKLYMEWQKFLENNIDYAGISEAYKMAFKALEQEPCEKYIKEIDHLRKYIYKLETQIVEQEPCTDAISRADVIDLCESKDPNYAVIHFKEDVECLPSVSTEKVGRWEHYGGLLIIVCSQCRSRLHDDGDIMEFCRGDIPNYCPNCGCRMIGVEEIGEVEE